MSSLITTLGTVFTALIADVGTIATTCTAEGNEILLVPVACGLAYTAVHFFKKMTSAA